MVIFPNNFTNILCIGKKTGLNEEYLIEEAESLRRIITCEVSIYLLRRSTGHCGSVSDNMVDIRRNFINEHNKKFSDYIEDQDFY